MSSIFDTLNDSQTETFRPLVGRLNLIFSDRFKCRILYKPAIELNSQSPDLYRELRQRLKAPAEHTTLGDELIVPVYLANGELQGFAILIEGAKLRGTQLEQALDLLECTLVQQIQKSDELRKLIAIEQTVATAERSSNILPFRPLRPRYLESFTRALARSSPPMSYRRPILLRAAHSDLIGRTALAMHEALQTTALVSLQKLTPTALDHAVSWHDLGQVALLIDDVTMLTLDQLHQLSTLAALCRTSDAPQVLVGYPESAANENSLVVQQALANFPHVFRCPDRDTTTERLHELVLMFLFAEPPPGPRLSPLEH